MKINWLEYKYNIKRKWSSFTYYLYRKKFYRFQLFKRFCKTVYYGPWEMVYPLLDYSFKMLLEFWENGGGKDIYEGEDQVSDVLTAKQEMKDLVQ